MKTDKNTALLLDTENQREELIVKQNELDVFRSGNEEGFSVKKFLLPGFLGVYSSILYWVSCSESAKRYIDYLPHNENLVALAIIPALSGFVTNALFNTESCLVLSEKKDKQKPADMSKVAIYTEWSLSFLISVFGVLPTWHLSMRQHKDGVIRFLVTTSSLINVLVYLDGSKNLLEWGKAFLSKSTLVNRLTCRFQSNSTVDQDKQFILKKLNDALDLFCKQNTQVQSHIVNILNPCDTAELYYHLVTNHKITDVMDTSQGERLHVSDGDRSAGGIILFHLALFFALSVNFGLVIEGYRAGNKLSNSMTAHANISQNTTETLSVIAGWFFVAAILIPNLGFAVRGIFSNEKLIRKVMHDRQLPWLFYILTASFGLLCACSGFTADELGYESWLNTFGNSTRALVVGIIHNLGAVLMYNFPQCINLAQRLVTSSEIERNRKFEARLKTLIERTKELSFVQATTLLQSLSNIGEAASNSSCQIAIDKDSTVSDSLNKTHKNTDTSSLVSSLLEGYVSDKHRDAISPVTESDKGLATTEPEQKSSLSLGLS